jgi:uncharacterized protein YbjT (DUF2867 family)
MPRRTTFVTGATGFVGGRLVAALLERGDEVLALTRDASRLDPREGVNVIEGDVADVELVADALQRARVAYYLVHSLGTDDFEARDRRAAVAFADAAERAGLERIVYLSGLGRDSLSPHLASRQEVGLVLRQSAVTTVELRASVVVGHGSVSFDTFEALAELPVTVLPDWIDNLSQPIAVDDVVAYLLAAGDIELDDDAVFEIGGRDVVPYREILGALGGTAATVPMPGLVADVARYLKGVQPERMRVVTDLLDSLRVDTTVQDDSALSAFDVRPRGLAEAIAAA